MIDIEVHELDSTFDDQYVLGIQIEYEQFNQPGEYDFAEHEVVDDILRYRTKILLPKGRKTDDHEDQHRRI